jgi:DNA-binding IclR family transcriptional regulator
LTAPKLRDIHPTVSGVTSLERGLNLLDLLIEIEGDVVRRDNGLSIQQAAAELGVHKSTASRLMATLVAKGYAVPKTSARRGFRLGPAVQTHQILSIDQRRLRELVQPFLVELVEMTGECAHAAVALGTRALVIDDVETGQPLRVVAGRGRKVPLHCTSAGKCLLAYGLARIPKELPARTGRTITNPKMLRLHLTEIVEQGYAVDDEENDAGVRCISAPVFNARGDAIGCIGIDGPSVRMVDSVLGSLAENVKSAAHRLSVTIGELEPAASQAAGVTHEAAPCRQKQVSANQRKRRDTR